MDKTSEPKFWALGENSKCPFNGLASCSGGDIDGCPLGFTQGNNTWCALSFLIFNMANTGFIESFERIANALERIADQGEVDK